MQRYFIKSEQLKADEGWIVGSDVHHVTHVMRGQVGDRVVVCTDAQQSYVVEITAIDQSKVWFKRVETKEEEVELPVSVTLAQGLIKGDKFEWVVQKATECGVHCFLPVVMQRSVVKLDVKKVDQKVTRWQKIALEAARQAHRQVVPVIKQPMSLQQLMAQASQYEVCLFAYEQSGITHVDSLSRVINQLEAGMRVLILIGPEGGIDSSEAAMLTEAGFISVGLGPRILRTETAPIYVMSALSYGLEIERRI
ncbi:MAG: 16S rRNA (uracil(1498)-N(3))-methyltransferase [Defluviitaleaceae bacterium]|nr:16S rRNA (uracil(1498)-N(3))-methyltransferase [Defluviitaleaceae bacterium]